MGTLKLNTIGSKDEGRRVVITDPDVLASLRPSEECMRRCEEIERMTMPRRGRWI